MRTRLLAIGLILATPCLAQDDPQQVVLADTTPLTANAEMARRVLSPLTVAHLDRALAKVGQHMGEQPVTPADEKFLLHVPPDMPAGGYGVMVFVPASRITRIPRAWTAVLDRLGMIFVSAMQSGNEASMIGRRMPLALVAAANVPRRYPVNPEHVFVAGMSGGSRVAQRLALAYPDIFRGALLNSGSDPIGEAVTPLPPRELFALVQARSRFVYLSGENDIVNLDGDTKNIGVMRRWCVGNLDQRTMSGLGHVTADAVSLDWALRKLLSPVAPAGGGLASCRAALEQQMADGFHEVDALRQAGKREDARARLEALDTRFGGLAAPQSVALDAALERVP